MEIFQIFHKMFSKSSQSRGCKFESRLSQLSFRCLTRVNATCIICLPPMGYVYLEKQPVAWEDCCVEYWCEETRKHMSRWTGRRDMTEKMLKTALNPNQSINESHLLQICCMWERVNSVSEYCCQNSKYFGISFKYF